MLTSLLLVLSICSLLKFSLNKSTIHWLLPNFQAHCRSVLQILHVHCKIVSFSWLLKSAIWYKCTYLDNPSSISFLWAAYFSLTAWYSLLDCLKACNRIHTDLEKTKQKKNTLCTSIFTYSSTWKFCISLQWKGNSHWHLKITNTK